MQKRIEKDLPLEGVRLDKWLWAARFFKSRSLAHEAIDGGKVFVDGVRGKPSREVRCGQEVKLTTTGGTFTVVVSALADRRGSATLAATLYRESEESKTAREALRELHRLSRSVAPKDKPEGRERRAIRRLKEQE